MDIYYVRHDNQSKQAMKKLLKTYRLAPVSQALGAGASFAGVDGAVAGVAAERLADRTWIDYFIATYYAIPMCLLCLDCVYYIFTVRLLCD